MHLIEFVVMVMILLVSQINTLDTGSCSAMSSCTQNVDSDKMGNMVLKVALFPYLPDTVGDKFKSLLEYITKEFKKVRSDVTLELRTMDQNVDFYDLGALSKLLATDGTGWDVVEVDTVLLGDLVNTGLIIPQDLNANDQSDWQPATIPAVQFNGASYGYPHLMCGFFLFTFEDQIAAATTLDKLIIALGSTPTDSYRLVGNMKSSWGLPALWISSFQDANPTDKDMRAFALHDYEHLKFDSMKQLADLCLKTGNINNCLNGAFKDNDEAAKLFAEKKTKAMFGYSERLFPILTYGKPEDKDKIKVIPLPAGNKNNQPDFFTDAFVFRRQMPSDTLDAARSFVKFMATPQMQAALVASGDSPSQNTIPRYLLPMSKGAYDQPLLLNDRFYQQYLRNLNGFPYPTIGYYNTRAALTEAITKYIQ